MVSGDPSATAEKTKSVPKSKEIPKGKRTTTPYMTKYEKARVLGTRALQIRSVRVFEPEALQSSAFGKRVRGLILQQHECSGTG